jgi:hypothetical protein
MKNYIGSPHTGHITIHDCVENLSPRLVEAMNKVSHSTACDEDRFYRWEVTEAMYIPATNILHSYGYTPAVRS